VRIQLINTAGRVVTAFDVDVKGPVPQWCFVNGAIFIYRSRVFGDLFRYEEAQGLILEAATPGGNAPTSIVAH